MIKISKITDYGIVILSHLARSRSKSVWTAKELSQATLIPLPTVGKILKLFSKGGLLESTRGSQGGYSLIKSAESISMAYVIQVIEGRMAMTDCSLKENHSCSIQTVCANKNNWQRINDAIYKALENLTLADMSRPLPIQWMKKKEHVQHVTV